MRSLTRSMYFRRSRSLAAAVCVALNFHGYHLLWVLTGLDMTMYPEASLGGPPYDRSCAFNE